MQAYLGREAEFTAVPATICRHAILPISTFNQCQHRQPSTGVSYVQNFLIATWWLRLCRVPRFEKVSVAYLPPSFPLRRREQTHLRSAYRSTCTRRFDDLYFVRHCPGSRGRCQDVKLRPTDSASFSCLSRSTAGIAIEHDNKSALTLTTSDARNINIGQPSQPVFRQQPTPMNVSGR
jgi:hypothetical protein